MDGTVSFDGTWLMDIVIIYGLPSNPGVESIHFFEVIMVLTRTDKAVTVTINIPVLRNSVEFTLVELSIK